MNKSSEKPENDTKLGSTDLLSAFNAKIKDCERIAKECYQDTDEDCRDIGDYWRAAKIEISRFRNELFSANDEAMRSSDKSLNNKEK